MTDERATERARARVAELLDELARIQLQVVVVAQPDATRRAARERGRDAAIVAGRGELLEEAISAVRNAVLRTFSRSGFSGTWALTDMAVSVARAEDRVAAAAAFEEAAIAAIVEDLVGEDTLEVLRSTSDELRGMARLPSPGSLASIATPASDLRGPWATLLVVGMLALIVVGAFAFGTRSGSVVAVFAVAVVAGLLRRRGGHNEPKGPKATGP